MAPEERLLSVAEIARRLGVPESTVHYWKNRFAQHLPSAGTGRQKRFREGAVEVFRIIAEMFSTGHSTQDVMEVLGKSFPLTATFDHHNDEGVGATKSFGSGATHRDAPQQDPTLQGSTREDMAETAVRMAAVIAKEMGAEIARSIGEGLRLHLSQNQAALEGQNLTALPALSAADAEEISAIKSAVEDTCGRLDSQSGEVARMALENDELRSKLSVLEAELVRLRKDRRELEKYLLDKIKSVST